MDTKFIAMVGALVVLGGVVYLVATGSILPGGEQNGTSIGDDDGGVFGGNSDGDDQDSNSNVTGTGNATANETVNKTEPETEVRYPPATEECRVQEGDVEVDSVYSRAGPAFDAKKAESILHDSFNEFRNIKTYRVNPLLCDPEMRKVARGHSQFMAEEGVIGPISNRRGNETVSERYLDACTDVEVDTENTTISAAGVDTEDENFTVNATNVPEATVVGEGTENVTGSSVMFNVTGNYTEDDIDENITVSIQEYYGLWLYQRNQDADWEGRPLNQRVDVVQDYDDLTRDIRGVWVNEGLGDVITDSNMTHQGIGMHINRETRLVHVTHAICGKIPQ